MKKSNGLRLKILNFFLRSNRTVYTHIYIVAGVILLLECLWLDKII